MTNGDNGSSDDSGDDDDDEQDITNHNDNHNNNNKPTVDVDDYFKTKKDKEAEELQYDPDYNSNIPPAKLSYPAQELEFSVQSKIQDLRPKLGSKNIGCCTFSISPSLPEGIDFDSETGVISGFPIGLYGAEAIVYHNCHK